MLRTTCCYLNYCHRHKLQLLKSYIVTAKVALEIKTSLNRLSTVADGDAAADGGYVHLAKVESLSLYHFQLLLLLLMKMVGEMWTCEVC